MKTNYHNSVLLRETISALQIRPDGIYVDATLGRGGHAMEILKQLGPNGKLIGIDQDHDAIEFCQELFKNDSRVVLVEDNFINISDILRDLKTDYVDGVLMDLGVSSPQIDNAERGFSYMLDGPLDMRMDQSQSLTAGLIVNRYASGQLSKMFRRFGEVQNPSKVVRAIIEYRNSKPIETTKELVSIIRGALSPKELMLKNKHPEKVYFQALRIVTNNELDVINVAIENIAPRLKINGVLAVISFHSLEDKVVLEAFKKLSKNHLPKEIPLNQNWQNYVMVKPSGIKPAAKEVLDNPRAKSARLRILKKIK